MDDCKNLSDHEALIRRISATAQNLFVEFTEKKLLYRRKSWAKNWDNVLYCSDRCRTQKAKVLRP